MILLYLDKVSRKFQVFLFIFSVIAVFLVGYWDYKMNYEFYVSFFYIFPVILVMWLYGLISACIISFVAGMMELLNNLVISSRPFPKYSMIIWDFLILLATFGMVIYFLAIIKKLLEKEKNSARIDPLTGLPNRRFFYEKADIELNRARRFHYPVSLAYIDLDNFKFVNDNMGHETGDKLLTAVSQRMKSTVRDYDIPARLGGDEFVILFPEINEMQIKAAIDKVREKITEIIIENQWPVTLSIGVITIKDIETVSLEEMIKRADHLMYSVKKNGKNSIVFLNE